MLQYNFDETAIHWQTLGDFEHFLFSVLDIDHENNIADVIFKFEANKQIFLHRHIALNKTFVIQGEHHLYEPNGHLKETRTVGTYKTSPGDINPHRECGGDDGAIVLFSVRGGDTPLDGALYEVLDDDENIVGQITMADVIALHKAANA
jgi:anti-sigma factor ChrR (cupin superfamily)